ncbi:MAG: peptidylprolyl isomerase [Brumimicrobium sp.]|nr:peptidylprolyl isomerase [Brumimicrobium sp.]
MSEKSILLIFISLISIQLGKTQIIDDNTSKGGSVIDKVIAQVGNQPIYLSEIEAEKIQLKNEGQTINENSNCTILEENLYQKLLLNQSKIDSIKITDEQVNAEMENRLRTIEHQIGGREKLEKFYGKSYTQIKDEFREDIRNRMLAQEMERQVVEHVEVSPKEVEEFFNKIPEDSLPFINENISIQQIVIYPKISQTSIDAVITKLRKWREEVISGEKSFATLATVYSEDLGSARDGGKIEATRGMMVKPFEAAAFALNPGEVSDVVQTQYGYHLIQLLERKGDDYTVRHILLSPEIGRKELGDAATLLDECHAKLMKHEITWDQAVAEYSEDEETKQNQGIITNPYTGEQFWDVANINQIDPQIFEITNGLNVGQISNPALFTDMMNRKEGVRIVRIKNRTNPHRANLLDDYSFIKKAAENQKKTTTITDWVNKKIKKTYIRIDKNYVDCDFIYNWK